jgi:hypothetical protein
MTSITGFRVACVVTVSGLLACTTTTTKYIEVPDEVPVKDAGAAFDSQPPGDSGLGILTFRPETIYSGYDGVHTFQVPTAVYDADSDLQITASDPSALDIVAKTLVDPNKNGTPDNGKYFFVTVKKPGTFKLTATSKGHTAEATLTASAYTPDRWDVGAARYKTGEAGDPPCTDCHVNGKAIDHSPAALATVTDEKIGFTITSGIAPGGYAIKIDNVATHKWHVTDPEKLGLITYLRALEPRGFQ